MDKANLHSDPNEKLDLKVSIPLALQHVLAMFASNVTPSIIIAGAAGLAGADKVYLIQMAMLFSGVATLFQTIGLGPIGARLPIMQGTSFAFIPVMIPIVKVSGLATLFGSIFIGGIFHLLLGSFIGKIRRILPPLVTGTVVLSIGLALIPVGIKYAAGGVPLMGKPEFGAPVYLILAFTVVIVSMLVKFLFKGVVSSAAILIGLAAGYILGIIVGEVNFDSVANAAWIAYPELFSHGFDINFAAVISMCLMSVVSAIETVGDISGITKGGANREATDKEISGGTMADGLGTMVAGLFGGLPNTSFSQNVGVISMTGVMSRHVVTISAIILIVSGFIPKIGSLISAMPIAVLGGGVIVMFGMVVSAGLKMLSEVKMNRRNMVILALALSVGLGFQAVPSALQHFPSSVALLLKTGLLPSALIAIILNIVIPEETDN